MPLSIQTYNSVIKVYALGAYDLTAIALHQLYRYVRLVGSNQIAIKWPSCTNCSVKKMGMGLCQYVDRCFHASSLP